MKTALGIALGVVLLLFARAIGRATSGALYRLSSGYARPEDWLWVAAIAAPIAAIVAAYFGARREVARDGVIEGVEIDRPKLARGLMAIGGASFAVGVLFALFSDRYDTTRDLGLMLSAVGACIAATAWYFKGSET